MHAELVIGQQRYGAGGHVLVQPGAGKAGIDGDITPPRRLGQGEIGTRGTGLAQGGHHIGAVLHRSAQFLAANAQIRDGVEAALHVKGYGGERGADRITARGTAAHWHGGRFTGAEIRRIGRQRHRNLRHRGGIGLGVGHHIAFEHHTAGLKAQQVTLRDGAITQLAAQQRLGPVQPGAIAQRDLKIGPRPQRGEEILPQHVKLAAQRIQHLGLGRANILLGQASAQGALAAQLHQHLQAHGHVILQAQEARAGDIGRIGRTRRWPPALIELAESITGRHNRRRQRTGHQALRPRRIHAAAGSDNREVAVHQQPLGLFEGYDLGARG